MKTHAHDGGTPALTTSKNPIKPGPHVGNDFGAGNDPGAHGIQGLSDPDRKGKTGPARNAGSTVSQTKGSPAADHSAHTKAGVLGSDTRDTPKVTK